MLSEQGIRNIGGIRKVSEVKDGMGLNSLSQYSIPYLNRYFLHRYLQSGYLQVILAIPYTH